MVENETGHKVERERSVMEYSLRCECGRLFKILLDVSLHVYLTAKRKEYRGGWSFERGSASLRFPETWAVTDLS